MHEVSVLCTCSDVEHCTMERYIADVRTAYVEIERLKRTMVLLVNHVGGIGWNRELLQAVDELRGRVVQHA